MARKYKQGKYVVVNPSKYIGDPDKVTFRSSWELRVHKFLDLNPNVLRWSSEEIAIPYVHPVTHDVRRYFPDYWCEYKNAAGQIIQEVIEVKPLEQTKLSRSKNLNQRLSENIVVAVNMCKWKSAIAYCDARGIKFRVVTENQIFK